jgi:hypothetical protein
MGFLVFAVATLLLSWCTGFPGWTGCSNAVKSARSASQKLYISLAVGDLCLHRTRDPE